MNQRGFTLVELSIVLVIIGLLISGVLVGRDLIKSAENRKIITTLESYYLAVNTFKLKYKGLPGDIADATDFGFSRDGNGDGCIGSCVGGGISSSIVANFDFGSSELSEIPAFWQMLSQSKLIAGSYDGDAGTVVGGSTIGRTLPKVPYYPVAGWVAYTGRPYYNGPDLFANYIAMAGANTNTFGIAASSGPAAWASFISGMRPASAFYIDQKMDDGYPGAGKVQAHNSDNTIGSFPDAVVVDGDASFAPLLPATAGVYCSYIPAASTKWVYNVSDTGSSCGLRFKAPF
jgi:prepilin-type N-terminal cleavage/methylation domain-containing protein